MGGVAEVIVSVAVGLVKGEGAYDDGQGFEGFRAVGRTAFAGHDALDIGFDGQSDSENEDTVAGADAKRVLEGEGFAVGCEQDGACKSDGPSLAGCGEVKRIVVGLDGGWMGQRLGSAAWAQLHRSGGIGGRSEGDLFVVPESPQSDAKGCLRMRGRGVSGEVLARAELDECECPCSSHEERQKESAASHGRGFLSGERARRSPATWAALAPWPAGK